MSNVLIISPEGWDAHTVSKHHYAMTLAELGHHVFFLNPPDDSLKQITIVTANNFHRLNIVSAPRVAPGLRFIPSFFRTRLERRWLERLEKRSGKQIDIVWLFENSRFFDMRFAGDRLKIYHQVDLNQDFHAKTAASTGDICFCTTNIIYDVLHPYNELVFKIHHGTPETKSQASLSISHQNRFSPAALLHAVYIGNMDMVYLDVALLLKLVQTYPNTQFHFIGGYRDDNRLWVSTKDMSNVTWWGKVESQFIPSILEKADILLVTYKEEEWKNQASPHKFMEYFASGKVIVSTYTDEYKDKRVLLEMTDNSAEFIQLFGEVSNDLDKYNSYELRQRRVDFAESNSYEKQIDKIFTLLKKTELCVNKNI